MKYTGPKVRLSRQLGLALTPKAGKVMENKPYPPGQHGQTKRFGRKMSDYKRQLMEKQRLRAQYNISRREQEVLELVCAGRTNQEISELLFISLQTVKDHVSRIYKKTGVRNRVQLITLLRDRTVRDS